MPAYEYRFTNATGLIELTSTRDLADDAEAVASAEPILATLLDFEVLEIWFGDRQVTTVRRQPAPDRGMVG